MNNPLYTSRGIEAIATMAEAEAAVGFLGERYAAVIAASERVKPEFPGRPSVSAEMRRRIVAGLVGAVIKRQNMWTKDSQNWPPEARVVSMDAFLRIGVGLNDLVAAYSKDNPQPVKGRNYDNGSVLYPEVAERAIMLRLDEVVRYLAGGSAEIIRKDAGRLGDAYKDAFDARMQGKSYQKIEALIGEPAYTANKLVGTVSLLPLYSAYITAAHFADRAYGLLANGAVQGGEIVVPGYGSALVKGGEVFVDADRLVKFYKELSELAQGHYERLRKNRTSDDKNAVIVLDLKEILEQHGVPTYVVNAVSRSGLGSLGKILSMDAQALLEIKNLGPKGLAELSRVREERGYGPVPGLG
ncbi:hypothetical protein HYV82_03735 [Candidatus Woesearchaeota archaeon]|nr:hypothetical protein [Candidatus Woesearchaeota archaeon]